MIPFSLLAPARIPTRRVSIDIGGAILNQFSRVSITRDLGDIAGSFEVDLRDAVADLATWPYSTPIIDMAALELGSKATVSIDGEPVLVGWLEDKGPDASEWSVTVSIAGRDVTGDLVDCAAAPKGPSEYRNITVLELAKKICAPFKINVRADVDVGDKFDRVAIDAGETALSAIEKYARQRALLVTSDGVGSLVLTRSGQKRAPADIVFPGFVTRSAGQFSHRERFSDYFVKGQAEKNGGARGKTAKLDATADPLDAAPAESSSSESAEAGGVLITGHAQDPEIKRWRPTVSMAKTQSTKKSAQTQAEWMKRTRRAKGERLDYTVQDWRAGASMQLWRPNELTMARDQFQQLSRDMLIAGVCYMYGDRGEQTRLRLTGPEAYDLQPEGERRQSKRGKSKSGGSSSGGGSGKLDGTAFPL